MVGTETEKSLIKKRKKVKITKNHRNFYQKIQSIAQEFELTVEGLQKIKTNPDLFLKSYVFNLIDLNF